jgi:hypothetical protein
LEEALSVFARLSDGEERAQQTRQTACYRAIVMMDAPGRSAEEIRTALEQVLGPIPEAIERLASSADPANRYEHHLLLRWLVGSGDAACREAYVALRPAWQTGVGHPWPLIGLYRGMLLQGSDPDAARGLAMEAAASAFSLEQGPVVRLIGACCRVVAMAWGAPGWKEGIEEIARLREALPAAEVPLRRLEEWLQRPSASLETLQGVLPFNFH